ncbi:MAG: hypothetical protein ACLUJR_12050 [Mediterraneibacter gnavus]
MQKQAQAEWLRACIEQRSHTLQRIADILVDFQRMFLDSGKDMKPIRQKDVAQIMEVNESTISRAVKRKISAVWLGRLCTVRFYAKRDGGSQ